MYLHDEEEFGFVNSGNLTLVLENERYEIGAGESFYFPSHIPLDWKNNGMEDAEVIWVITPPTF